MHQWCVVLLFCSPSQVVQLYRAGLVDTSQEDVQWASRLGFTGGLDPKERDTSSSRRRDDKSHLFRTLAAAADLWRCFKGIPHRFIHRDGRRGCPCARYERRGELFAKLDPGRKTERRAARKRRRRPNNSSRARGAARRNGAGETAAPGRRERVDRRRTTTISFGARARASPSLDRGRRPRDAKRDSGTTTIGSSSVARTRWCASSWSSSAERARASSN